MWRKEPRPWQGLSRVDPPTSLWVTHTLAEPHGRNNPRRQRKALGYTYTFITRSHADFHSMTVLFVSLFHLPLLPIIASSPVSVLPVWSTLSLSTPPQENTIKSAEIRAWSESDAGNNESQALSTLFHSYSHLNPERCVGAECRRREEQRKRWETGAEQEKEGMGAI